MSGSSNVRLAGAEFVGTALVVVAGPGVLVLGGDDVGTLEVALASGVAMTLAIGAIGAVANPMFSLALWAARGITGRELGADVVGQLLGALFGGLVLWGLNDTTRLSTGTNGWEPSDSVAPGVDLAIGTTGFAELGVVAAAELVVGVLVVVVLLSATTLQRSNGAIAAFTGAAYGLGTLLLFELSGAGLNPARSVGVAAFADTDPGALGQVWLFVLVPLVAAVAGLFVWLAIDDATVDDTVFDDTVVDDLADAVTGDD